MKHNEMTWLSIKSITDETKYAKSIKMSSTKFYDILYDILIKNLNNIFYA